MGSQDVGRGAGRGAGGAVALLAGEGRLAEALAQEVRARGRPLIGIQMSGENPGLAEAADVYLRAPHEDWLAVVRILQERGVTEALFAGRIGRVEIAHLGKVNPLLRTLMDQTADPRDQRLHAAAAAFLEQLGITVASQIDYAGHLVPGAGRLAGPALEPQEERDIARGVEIARVLAAQDVGQTLVLKGGVILAVEAAEGTDATILRGGAMVPRAVVVKVSRPDQDPRFEVPAVGVETIRAMRRVEARVLAVEAGRCIVLDREALAAEADGAGITVTCIEAPPLRP